MPSIARHFVLAAVLALPATAQQLFRTVPGPAANAQFGKACITITDQNGDGYKDLLVGAPGFNSGRGAVYCISGAYLATGTGASTLWSIQPAANPDDQFGFALAMIGDVTGDGIADFLIGQPGYDKGTAASDQNVGAVRLVDGASHAVISLVHEFFADRRFGAAIAACGDLTGDGKPDVAVGAPGSASTVNSGAYLISGAKLAISGLLQSFYGFVASGGYQLGTSLASGFDLDGDGLQDIAMGMPGCDASGAPGAGGIWLDHYPPANGVLYFSSIAGERLGESLDAANDYDGDGVVDIVVGAPKSPGTNNTQPGRVVVLSGARFVASTPPYELYTLLGSPGSPVAASYHFGASVRASADLNNDGVGDILVGSPDFFTTGNPGKGGVTIYSGATGVRIGGLIGANNDHLGDALGGAVNDYDGDGFKEFVVAGSLSDAGGTDSGVIKVYRLFPCFPSTYCTGKLNSLGCSPTISFSGIPSESAGAPFLITASNFINQKNGLLFYSHQPVNAPFQGGIKCVANPTVRTPVQNSGGSSSGSDCTGSYSFDFNDWIVNGWDFSLAAGLEVFAQYWSRDPQTASHTSLSNAVRFLINP